MHKNMKKTLYTILALAVSFIAVSCNDVLEETPKGQLLTNSAFTHSTDLESAMGVLRYKVSRASFYDTQFVQGAMGDDWATHPASNKAAIREFDCMEISTGNSSLKQAWHDMWLVIKAANFIINGADKTPDVSEEEIARYVNTAKFWRAWAYFDMVRTYGALPLVTTLDIDYGTGLTSVAGIYDQIIADFTDATALPNLNENGLCPEVASGINNDPNSGAAHAMLACVYLNMAGWPLNKGQEYYKLAAQECEKVITGPYYYKTYPKYSDIHSVACNWNNTEAIISVYYDEQATNSGDSSLMTRGGISDFPDGPGIGAYNNTRGEYKFYYDFPEGPRKEAVYYPHCMQDGVTVPFWDSSVPELIQFPYFGEKGWPNKGEYAGKEYNKSITFDHQCNGWDMQAHMLIRLSEVYCWYAECLARTGGDLGKAADYLNQVRNRADGAETNMYSAGMGAEKLAEAAYNEHRWEIAGWWPATQSCFNDLVRLKKLEAHYNYRKNPTAFNFGGENFTEPYGPVETWADWRMFVPYPQEDAQRNPNLNVDPSMKITDEFINGTEVITQ